MANGFDSFRPPGGYESNPREVAPVHTEKGTLLGWILSFYRVNPATGKRDGITTTVTVGVASAAALAAAIFG